LRRAGFGASPSELERYAGMGVERTIDELLQPERVDEDFDGLLASLSGHLIDLQNIEDVQTWWLYRMVRTRRPLVEKLTLFWHGHFATGENKTRDYRLMLKQNEMFRAHAAGNLRDLLVGILKDPGMLVYLDNGENIKSHPNENFGRELLELFSMGVGNYTERDVREAARAFTGWTNNVLEFKFDVDQHDAGPKTFLGQTGPFNGDDIIDIILKQPVTAEFVAGKIYKFFVRDEVAPPVRAALGRTFRDGGYQMKPLLTQIFLSKDFYSEAATATQIKSPVQLVVSTYKKLGLREIPTIPDFGRMTASLGQSLFDPPNVAGWAGGRTWITPSTLLQRGNLFREVLFPNVKGFRPPDRSLSLTDQGVGERLARGMDITDATKENDAPANMMAESNMMVDRDEDYNTRYAGYKGALIAWERTKTIPRHPAAIDLTAMVNTAGADTVDKVVDHFAYRFLSVKLAEKDRNALVAFLRGKVGSNVIQPGDKLEESLRELLYLVLSTPEYQLG